MLRYQLGNHLGTVAVELDSTGGVISYEEYHPYGTTSWQAPELNAVSKKGVQVHGDGAGCVGRCQALIISLLQHTRPMPPARPQPPQTVQTVGASL